MDTPKEKRGWNDEELEASVDAYLKMLRLELSEVS
jgi:5-methylcytosine-specific restriction protein A